MGDTKKVKWNSRGYIPHIYQSGLIQHITFHLGDSLPKSALQKMEQQLECMDDKEEKIERRKRINQLLDAGYGSCLLGKPEHAELMQRIILHFDDERYKVLSWVIMPNHVHVLIEPMNELSVGKIVQSWKRYFIHEAGITESPFWQRDYFDRYVRNEGHFQTVVNYIENNPVAAGLVSKPNEWKYSSAWGR